MVRYLILTYLISMFVPAPNTTLKLVYTNNFENDSNWIVEQMPGGTTTFQHGWMEIDDINGCTVWFRHKLDGDIKITFDVVMLKGNGENDRVSDLNFFWMATDPKHPDSIFYHGNNRNGKFAQYHSLQLYYVGYGANNNTTTRFRRYPGDGTRPMLPGHDITDAAYMNIPNKIRHIEIESANGVQTFMVDGEVVFRYNDEQPFNSGWFAFRTVNNHMKASNFKVFKIEK